MYLRQPEIARLVVDCVRGGVDLGHYELAAYVVMANHVHLLLRPLITPDRLLKSLKGATARYANRLVGRTGEPFWQKESYDLDAARTSACRYLNRFLKANSTPTYPFSSRVTIAAHLRLKSHSTRINCVLVLDTSSI
jgi:REP element-mobilizing transposase RayT